MEIEHLTLFSTHLDDQWRFYNQSLRMRCHKVSDDVFRVTTIHTILEFHRSDIDQYYHFAFLIPTGSLNEAISYLESRSIELLKLKGEKIIHFHPGRAIYFKDPDDNIVEWIERPSVSEAAGLEFFPANLVCINEIGFPVANPLEVAGKLMGEYGIDPQNPDGFSEDFCWVGDARGVIIVVKKGRNWLPTEIPSVTNHFKIQYRSGGRIYHLEIKGDEIQSVENDM